MRRTRRESPLDVAKKYIQQNVDRPILRRQYINDYIAEKGSLLQHVTKGYGVFVDDDNHISRGDFILEYTGKLITTAEADEIDDQSYIYYFELQGKTFAIDARDNERLGRFVNDAKRTDERCNCVARSQFICGRPRVLFFATKDIAAGCELRYDYGGPDLPWRQSFLPSLDPFEPSSTTNNEEIGSLVETSAAANDPVETCSATNNEDIGDPVETSAATNNNDIIFDPVETSSATNNEDIGDPVETSAATNNEEIGSLVETSAAANDPVETSSATNNEEIDSLVETSAAANDPVETSSATNNEEIDSLVETCAAANDPVETCSATNNEDIGDPVEISAAMNNNDIVVDPVETSAATNNRDIIFDPVETSSATNNEDIGDPVETSAATNNEEIGSLVETRAAANDPVETSSATNNEDFGVSVETSATMSNDDIVVDPVETSSAMSSEDLSDAVETSTATNENVVDPVNTSSAMKNDDVDTVENSSANDIDDTVPFSCSEDNDGSFNMATVCKQLSPTLKLPYGNNIDGQSRGTTSTVKLILSRTSNIKSEILKYQQCDKGNRPVRTQSFVAVSAAELIKCDRGVHLKNTEDLGDALSCLQSSGKGNPNMAQSVRPVSTILINKRHEHGKNCSFDIPVSAVDGCSGLPKTDCQSGIISNDKDHSKPSLNTYKPLRTVTTVKKGFPGKQHVTTSVRPPLGDPQMAQPVRAMSVPLSAIDGRIGLPKADWPSGICSDKEHNKPSVNTDQSMRTVTTVKKGLPRKQHETTSVKNGTSGTSCSLDICVQNFDVINASHSRTELSKKDQLSSISCYQKFLSNCNKYVENITDDDEIADDEEHSLENSEDDYVPDSSEDSVTSDNSKSSGDGMCIKGRNMVAKQRKRGYQMQKPQLGSDFSKKPKNNNDTDDDDASSESNESSEDDSYVTRRKLVSKAKRAHEKQKSVFDADSENRRKLKHTEPDSTVNNEDENQQRVHSTVAAASNCKNKRKWDKEYVCVYCSCHVKGKLPRHLERHHVAEFDVAKALSYPKKSKERKRLLKIISNKGNFHHNMAVYKQRSGTLIPNRRPSARVAAGDISDYIPCSTCYGTYSRHLMWKHKKECVAMRESNENSCLQTQGRGHVRVQARCAALIPVADGISKDFERKILNTMIPDDISLVVRNDKLITHYGVKLFDTYGHQNDRHQYISQKLRELARLLIDLMKHNKNIHGLWGCLKPQKFPIVVNSVRNIAGFDSSSKTYAKPSLALRLGHSLKACANEIESQAMIDGLDLDKQQAADFVRLCDAQWSSKVSTHALSTLHERKWNKPLLLPLTEDIKKLHTHLDNEANRCRSEPISKAVWYQLAQVLLAQIILFNRRRSGEVGRMKLSEYVKATESKIDMHDDVRSSLSALEKSLCDKFTRLEIRGKRGRKVPVLLASEMKDNVDYLISKRNEIGVAESNEYVFAVPTHQSDRHIRGSDCVRKFSVDCGASIPANLTSTKLRKHVATVSQILNLKKNELDVLAGFMGHDILVHRNYYRLPENTVEVAKVSRILLAMERGEISKYQGKSLEEITLDEHEATEGEHSDVDEEIQDDTEEGQISMLNNEECSDVEPDSDCQVEKQQKRNKIKSCGTGKGRRPWSAMEQQAVDRHLGKFLRTFKLPGRKDIDACLSAEPILAVNGRSWKNVKDYIRNRIVACKKVAK